MAKLYFFYSAMNAGKSTSLLQSDYNYRQRGMKTLLFTPQLDQREGEGRIHSRIGLSEPATIFSKDMDLFDYTRKAHHQEKVNCVFVDEAQFLTPAQVLQLTMICDQLNIPVLTYGLRTDFRGEPFEGSKYLLAWAEELVEVKTVCRSGRKATMSARLNVNGERVFEGEQVQIGYHYEPMSRHIFQLEKISPIGYVPPTFENTKQISNDGQDQDQDQDPFDDNHDD
jgi:thymidine kinase